MGFLNMFGAGNEKQQAAPTEEAPEMQVPGLQEQLPEIKRGPDISTVNDALKNFDKGYDKSKEPFAPEMEDGEEKKPTIH